MKILELIDNRENINPKLAIQIQQGQWYHAHRVDLVRTDTKFAVVSMNIFERALATLLNVLSIDYASFAVTKAIQCMEGDKGTLIGQTTLSSGTTSPAEPQRQCPDHTQLSIPQPPSQPLQSQIDCSNPSSGSPAIITSIITRIEPISRFASRPTYPSFSTYRKDREMQGEPVDLIIGRGTICPKLAPKLNDQRYVLELGENKSYRPFTVDIDPDILPDFKASIKDTKEMDYFPDASVDDIYLERIYPTSILRDVRIYFNAARILKVHGTLVADFNDGIHTELEREKQLELMRTVFAEFRLPFWVTLEHDKNSRSDLNFQKFVCSKYEDFDQTVLLQRGFNRANNELYELFRKNKLDF